MKTKIKGTKGTEYKTEYKIEIKIIQLLIKEADRLKIDRDKYMKERLEILNFMCSVSTFKDYEIKENPKNETN